MTLSLAVTAAATYTSALLLARSAPPAAARAVLATAVALVLGAPLLALAPAWSAADVPVPAALSAPQLALGTALQEPAGAVVAAAGSDGGLATLAVAGWAAGFAVALLRLGADALAVRRLRRTATERHGDVATGATDVPVVVGVWRPLVLLPPSAAGWSPSQRAHVLAHERAHVQGHDNAWLALARLAACVHWFDPLAHAAVAALREACEHRADEVALAGGADPVGYAGSLVAVARGRSSGLTSAMARPSGLARRVVAALGPRRPTGLVGVVARAGAVALCGAALSTFSVGDASPARRGPPSAEALRAEADALEAEFRPESLVLLVLDAHTGEVLAEEDRGGLAHRPVALGSVVKPFVAAAALGAGVAPDTTFPAGSMATILAESSNPGAAQIGERAGRDALDAVWRRVGLPVPPASVPIDGYVLGDGVLATPAQLAAAWVQLGGHGALDPVVAGQVRELLRGVTESSCGTGTAAAVPGTSVAGKTGTSRLVRADGSVDDDATLASFVGLVPAEDPDWVVLVAVADPKGESRYGGVVAAPAFRHLLGSR